MSGLAHRKTDVTVQLPDEVLSHVFSFLALSDKLRSETVNRKFQRCVREELSANPQPLELDIEDQLLNGHRVPLRKYSSAVEALAKRAKFSSVQIELDWGALNIGNARIVERVDSLLSLLVSHNQCLTKVTAFVTFGGCSQAVLKSFLDKCSKLSILRLEFEVRPLKSRRDRSAIVFPLNLGQILKNKRLTELHLCPFRFPRERLVHIFKAIEPNVLKKLNLVFNKELLVDMVELVDAISPTGSSLEQMRLDFYSVDVQLDHLFQSLDRLSALRKCEIRCLYLEPRDQFVAAATSLFMKSDLEIDVRADSDSLFTNLRGCEIVNMIRQIQNMHPNVVVDFDARCLILTLGNVSIRKAFAREGVEDCGAEDCVHCHSFYPCLLSFLKSEAEDAAVEFMDVLDYTNWQLDRCRVDKLLDDLTLAPDPALTMDVIHVLMNDGDHDSNHWRPLSVEFDEDQQITINFETKGMQHHLFSIIVGCGRCLTIGCMKCMG